MTAQALVLFFKDIHKDDVPLVGGKSANLGEMVNAGFRVPDGFAITVKAYEQFLTENELDKKIYQILNETDVDNPDELNRSSSQIRKMIQSGKVPDDVKREVVRAYKKLSGSFSKALVAARSSATAEDMPGTSFAGQQITFLNIKGEANLLSAVRDCWSSLFTPRSIFYRVQNKIVHKKVALSVVVQKMIQSEVSGVMFTMDPVTKEKDRIIIESVWGLGEMIVQGSVVPDRYVVQKETFDILSKQISEQTVQLTKKGVKTIENPVPKKHKDLQKISDKDIIYLAKQADLLQKHYYFPQDAEWAKDAKGVIYLIQTRPVTAMEPQSKEAKANIVKTGAELMGSAATPILTGTSASPGIGTGRVKILKSPKEISRVKDGDVLVTVMTSPDYVPAMKKASAIITDEGGMTSHAAIVSRELGIPCIVGAKVATEKLLENQLVTVDGGKGVIYLGGNIKIEKSEKVAKEAEKDSSKKTATKIYVNLAEPERASEIAKLNVDGVGLLRAEFMMANIGIHPKESIRLKKQADYIDKLCDGIKTFCKAFYPRPVVYRASDFKTNEYRALEGGKRWEPVEPNPLLGFRGAYRYVSNQEVFTLELKALKKVLGEYNNLHLMIPFVRSPNELQSVKKVVASEGLFTHTAFKFLMMVELPVNVISLEDFIAVGIDGVSIGSNDLTMLITGTDRDNSEVAETFDERSPAVEWALKRTIKICNRNGITSSICGQAPSVYDDFCEKLVEWGVTSISVNPDAVGRVREVVYNSEKKMVSKGKL